MAQGLPLVAAVAASPPIPTASRRVLVAVEDAGLAELLVDALCDAGHSPDVLEDVGALPAAVESGALDAAIVDLDMRRAGERLAALIRARSPTTTIIALLPCGGLPPGHPPVAYDRAVEKPARLVALLSALAGAREPRPR